VDGGDHAVTGVRLFGHVTPHAAGRRVGSARIRLRADNVPGGAEVLVTDAQFQPGNLITGWTLAPPDLDVQPVGGWQWRNGTLQQDRTVIVMADVDACSPIVADVRGEGAVRVGAFRFGEVSGSARMDAHEATATQGAGLPPAVTARSDSDVTCHCSGRALLTLAWRGLATSDGEVEPPPPPDDIGGPVTVAHTTWNQVLAWHDTWAGVLAGHDDWS
jgi:hypothetical protein